MSGSKEAWERTQTKVSSVPLLRCSSPLLPSSAAADQRRASLLVSVVHWQVRYCRCKTSHRRCRCFCPLSCILQTFTKWFNNHLRKKNYPPITDPATDFETGIKLMQIVNALYDVPIPKHNANPKLRPHKLDNIETALKMVETAKIKTNFLKHTHLIDPGNNVMILGMMC